MTDRAIEPASDAKAGERGLAVVGALTGLAALFSAAACCVLPLALAAIGLGAGGLAWFVPYHWPLTVGAFAILAIGWIVHARKVRACAADSCDASSRSNATRTLLLVATFAVAFSTGWNFIEQPLMRLLGGN